MIRFIFLLIPYWGFAQVNAYKIYQNTGIPDTHFIQISKAVNPIDFYNELINEKLSHFYGIYINDSMKVVMSNYLKDNPSCIGRILDEVKKYPIDKIEIAMLKASDFQMLNTNKGISFDKERNIILLYSLSAGKKLKKQYKEMYEYYQLNKLRCNLYLLVL